VRKIRCMLGRNTSRFPVFVTVHSRHLTLGYFGMWSRRYLRSVFSYGLSTPDVLRNFPVRCLRLHRVLMFNELKQKEKGLSVDCGCVGYTVVRTATEITVDFLTVLIHDWWVTVQNIIRWLVILRILWIFYSFQERARNQFTAPFFHMFINFC
jgi:hypothetical protein